LWRATGSVVLRITTFNDQTYPNLSDGIAKQVEELGGIDNVNGFVLDLRNNPGGDIQNFKKLAEEFWILVS
jgi:carboxyl-terminal processing protease